MSDPYSLRNPDSSIYGFVEQFRKLVTDAGLPWLPTWRIVDGFWIAWGNARYGLVFTMYDDRTTDVSFHWGLELEEHELWEDPTDEQLIDAWRRFVAV